MPASKQVVYIIQCFYAEGEDFPALAKLPPHLPPLLSAAKD